MNRTAPALGRSASFWVAAAVVAHTLWTSAAPAMTYPLYAREWGLTPTATTAIFAVYPVFVVATLICFGDISDYIGRRTAMLFGLAASLIGVLLFAVAPDVVWLFVGRAFMGIGVGLSASPAAAAMVEFSPAGQTSCASAITTAAQSLGLTLALLVGGGLIEYGPLPTRLNFWVLAAVIGALFAAAWFLPRHTPDTTRRRWRLKALSVPAGLRKIFLTATTAVTAAFALGALMLSLGSQIAHDLIGSSNTLVNGSAMAIFAISSGIVALLARRMPPGRAMMLGGVTTAIGMALLGLSVAYHALPLFLASGVATGAGYSLLFSSGLGFISMNAPAHHRAGTISTLYFVAYLLQGVVAIVLGRVATAWGLDLATDLGAAAIALFGLLALVFAALFGRAPKTGAAAGVLSARR